MDSNEIIKLLSGVIYPENSQNIVALGMVENLIATGEKIQFTLVFPKAKDPWANSVKKRCEQVIRESYPQFTGATTIFIKEVTPEKAAAKKPSEKEKKAFDQPISHIIAISSAKGGVGKSTVTANLAATLRDMGYRVGILDADIYGPSQPLLFGVEQYKPDAEIVGDKEWILPCDCDGVKLMSIGFFINPNDALVWRGPMATSALKQMIHQTRWGALDFLLIDLPPGTGDVHLSIIQEIEVSAAVIVTTPQKIALADVVRGINMFRGEKIAIPVLGIVENMAWFTPKELPDNKYYIFGKNGGKELSTEIGIDLLSEIPLVISNNESADYRHNQSETAVYYKSLAQKIVEKLD